MKADRLNQGPKTTVVDTLYLLSSEREDPGKNLGGLIVHMGFAPIQLDYL
jgi:hypothetical protein